MAIENHFRKPALEHYRSNLASRNRVKGSASGWPPRAAVLGAVMLATVSLGFGLSALSKLPVARKVQYRCLSGNELIVRVVGSPEFMKIAGEAGASHRLLRSPKYPEGWLGVNGALESLCGAAGRETQEFEGIVF